MIRVEVWGDYASFNRPELKVERFSYDVMTPSAARNILQAIYWHPTFDWIIDRIYILNPIKKMSIKRNEMKDKLNYTEMHDAAFEQRLPPYLTIRQTQRSAVVLKDVRYIIEAHFVPKQSLDEGTEKFDENKIYAIMCERLKKGQCFNTPFLGCREFSANFRLVDNSETITPFDINLDLGVMLYDNDYCGESINPYFFKGIVKHGILDLTSVEVLK